MDISTSLFCCAVAAILATASPAQAETIDLFVSSDTYITEHPVLGGPGSTHGSDQTLSAIGVYPFRAYPLVQFDLTSLSGRIVTGTPYLDLYVINGLGSSDFERQVSVYEVTTPWNVSTVTFDNFGADPGVQFGADTGASPLTTEPILWPGPGQRHIYWQIPAALVQKWIDTPSSNHGLLVYNQAVPSPFSIDLGFAAYEHSFPTAPPRLSVSLAPGPGSLPPVTFADANLEAAVRQTLGKPTGSILLSDMAALDNLDASNRGIVSLSGLETATHLRVLRLDQNPIVDPAPLGALVRLVDLNLDRTRLASLAFVSALTSLETLRINDDDHGMTITDYSPLSSATQLGVIHMVNHRIRNSAVLRPLIHLWGLVLNGGVLADGADLAALPQLRYLHLGEVGLQSVAFLGDMPQLLDLNLSQSSPSPVSLSDLSVVSGLTNLNWLKLSGRPLTDAAQIVPWLANTPRLTGLDLTSTPLTNGTALANLGSVERLSLTQTRLRSLAFLVQMPQLVQLDINNWTDTMSLARSEFDVLASLTHLVELQVSRHGLRSLEFLRGHESLELLSAWYDDLTDLSPLADLPRFRTLYAGFNNISVIPAEFGTHTSQHGDIDLSWNFLDLSSGSAVDTQLSRLRGLGYNLVVNNQRDLPAGIDALPDRYLKAGDPLPDLSFSAGVSSRFVDIVSVVATSTVQGVVKDSDLVIDGYGGVRLLQCKTQAGTPGTTRIKLTVNYASGPPALGSFLLSTFSSGEVAFVDGQLEGAVRQAIGKPAGALTLQDMTGLTSLTLTDRGVTNLAGLETAVNLSLLILSEVNDGPGRTKDLSVLPRLSSLRRLYINGLSLTSIDFLRSMPLLEQLSMDDYYPGWMSITDYSPLGSLSHLQFLDMQTHRLPSAAVFKNLIHLKRLNLQWGNLPDGDDLAALPELVELYLHQVGLKSVDFLARMPQLQRLSLGHTGTSLVTVPDLAVLSNLTHLAWLSLDGRPISSAGQIVPYLQPLPALRELWMSGCPLKDGTDLDRLTQLTLLGLPNTRLESLAFLAGMPQLRDLDIGNWEGNMHLPDTAWSVFAGLSNLVTLNVSQHGLRSFGFLASNTVLEDLWAEHNLVGDLAPLLGLGRLNRLRLSDNLIADLGQARDLPAIRYLDVSRNPLPPSVVPGVPEHVQELRDRGVTVVADNLPFASVIQLPVDRKLSSSAGLVRGMQGRIHQSAAVPTVNTLLRAEQQLQGVFGPSDYPVTFTEDGPVNYDNEGIPEGVFGDKLNFPNLGAVGLDGIAMSVETYVEFKAGRYLMGVNSDDGFAVSTPFEPLSRPDATGGGWNVNPQATVLGSFDGGRGPANTVFLLQVPEDGLYPLRLLWEEGIVTASVDWWVIDLQAPPGERRVMLVNGDDSRAPKAYRAPISSRTPPVVSTGRVPLGVVAGSTDVVRIPVYIADAETSARRFLLDLPVVASSRTPDLLPPASVRIARGADGVFLEVLPEKAKEGTASIEIQAADADGLTGSRVIGFRVIAPAASVGYLHREFFASIGGDSIGNLTSDPRFPGSPTRRDLATDLEATDDQGGLYGQRLYGYLLPPVTGDYVFYLAGDNQAELYLSTDEEPAHRQLIAYEPLWASGYRVYEGLDNRDPSAPQNRSVPLHLVAGRTYYLETLHKAGSPPNFMSVAWQLPGGAPPPDGSAPIPGRYFSAERPLPGTVTSLTRRARQGVKVRLATLLADLGSGPGVALSDPALPATTDGGGTLTVTDDWVVYNPPPSDPESDSFAFTAATRTGQSHRGWVNLTRLAAPDGPSFNIVGIRSGEGSSRTVQISGIPGRRYAVQRAHSLTRPLWTDLGFASEIAPGLFEFTDTAPVDGPVDFYRSLER